MSGEGSGKGLGLFGKKGMNPSDVKLCILNKYDREIFFQSLREFGWDEVEEPFEFERDWPEKTIRKAAREHSAEINADLLVEIRDRDYSTNPHNDFVYYVWRSGPNTRGLPPPPGQMHQQVYAQQMQMQMLAEQQRGLIQQQQMLQRMQMQTPQQPPGVPSGQVCSRCGSNQIQFMANGLAKCIQCGIMFSWQQSGQSQAPAPVQAPQQPMQQGQVQGQQQPQPTQQPAQIPHVKPPVQPGAPTPPGSNPCPKCGNPLNVFPDGSFLCNNCGHTGK